MTSDAVTGVVWDLGNVLIDWDPRAAVAAGMGDVEADRFFDGFDFAAWNQSCDAGRPWSEALAELDHTRSEWLEHGRAYHRHFAASLTGELSDTVALVHELHAAGVPQVGLTNWSAELWPHAPARFEFLGLLEDVVVSGVVGLAKPDPAIYRLAAERCGLPPGSLVFVDDKAANVAAAEGVGMHGRVFAGADRLRTELQALGLPV
ncbi:HAD family phosphatase [Nocardioides sp. HM23]|uniref:HAD family hydrolase n=1 Tax=Nocardioides bizhenqiangii TaxID=3095076 RepID=UPI002ACA7699|nr:HAD family phosphatase [Nocardioides sp. HM23]MDZ5621392.1 HAD family phosphatase [Nocardioides sp. HM23]